MSQTKNPASRSETDKNPAHQADENAGTIKKPQVTDDTMPQKDLARGSEPETRAASSRR